MHTHVHTCTCSHVYAHTHGGPCSSAPTSAAFGLFLTFRRQAHSHCKRFSPAWQALQGWVAAPSRSPGASGGHSCGGGPGEAGRRRGEEPWPWAREVGMLAARQENVLRASPCEATGPPRRLGEALSPWRPGAGVMRGGCWGAGRRN